MQHAHVAKLCCVVRLRELPLFLAAQKNELCKKKTPLFAARADARARHTHV